MISKENISHLFHKHPDLEKSEKRFSIALTSDILMGFRFPQKVMTRGINNLQ